MGNTKNTKRSDELLSPMGVFMRNGKTGDIFLTEKEDRHVTAVSNYYNRKVRTERLIAVQTAKSNPIAKYITQITIL